MKGHIIMVHSQSSWGGNLKMVLAVARELKRMDFGVSLLHPHGEEYARRFSDEGITLIPYRFKGKFDLISLISLSRRLRKIPNILLHSHNRRADLLCALLGFILQVPTLTTQHGEINLHSETLKLQRNIPAQVYRLMLRLCFKRIVCVCERCVSTVRDEILHPPIKRMRFINNGIDVDKIKRREDVDWIKKKKSEFNLPEDSLIITHIGSIHKKGHEVFIPVLADLIKAVDKNIHSLIAGEGAKLDEARRLVKEHNMEERIHILGFRDDPQDILNISDIYLHPSLSEMLSISIIEAMAMELPVVATPVGGTEELVIPYRTGLLIPVNDYDRLYSALYRLIEDKKLRKRLEKNARKHIETNFTEKAMVFKYLKIYRELF